MTTSSSARVIRVIDGDTLKVRLAGGTAATVRLIGIDTPETSKPGTPIECGGLDATARMKKLALRRGIGLSVSLRTDPTQDGSDRFGRLLAYVTRAGVDFGRTMVLSGWATSYVYETSFQRVVAYGHAQSAAKAAPRGVWRSCGGDFHRRR
ncbi:MAG TPA: thermonuclease family protein [Solirubrobacteraceae bacterium]|nr:thermonuclease family protein [Solirubrobacteraceae bacterium]